MEEIEKNIRLAKDAFVTYCAKRFESDSKIQDDIKNIQYLEHKKQEINEKEAEDFFISFLNGAIIKWNPKYPDSTFYLKDGETFAEYYDGKESTYPIFWCDYDKIWSVFEERFRLNYDEIQILVKTVVERHYKLRGITPFEKVNIPDNVENHCRLRGITPPPHYWQSTCGWKDIVN